MTDSPAGCSKKVLTRGGGNIVSESSESEKEKKGKSDIFPERCQRKEKGKKGDFCLSGRAGKGKKKKFWFICLEGG